MLCASYVERFNKAKQLRETWIKRYKHLLHGVSFNYNSLMVNNNQECKLSNNPYSLFDPDKKYSSI